MTRNREYVTRRALLGAIGIGAFTGTATPASAQVVDQGSRPTLTVESPECETLTIARDDRGPPVEVVVDGPEPFAVELGRGESEMFDVAPGTYEISAFVRGERGGTDRPVVVEGSPVEVEACLPPGVDVWVNCAHYWPLHVYNPLDRDVYFRLERIVAETGQINTRVRSRLEPGETEMWLVTNPNRDPVYHYKYWVTEAYGDEPVPINGSLDPLIITEPCEELDLPRSRP